MSSIAIRDLPATRDMDRTELAAVRGGNSMLAKLGAVANVNVVIDQDIVQFQDIEVNVLRDVGVIGAKFAPVDLKLAPKQFASNRASL